MLYDRHLIAAALAGLSVASATQAATPELRGTWLTTTASTALDAGAIPTTMQRLGDAGLNTVYVEAWKNGYANFRSPTLDALLGGFPGAGDNPSLLGRDLLAETSAAARDEGLVHVAWFEYGLAAQFGPPSRPLAQLAADNGWLLQDQAGRYANGSNAFTWMNPLVPEVRELLVGMTIDAVRGYGLDGVQFDDRLAWPVEFGYDPTTRAAYLAETGRALPANPRDADFTRWRAEKVEALAAEITTALRAEDPDLLLSASPSVFPFSLNNYAADWTDWADAGLFDEYVPQVYRSSFDSFAFEWQRQQNAVGDAVDSTGAGLRVLGTGARTEWSELLPMLERLEQDEAYGHSFWYADGLLNPDGYLDLVADFYDLPTNGYADHPLVLVRKPGDATGDRQVNLADFGILRANFGSIDADARTGDFNGDGLVNLADFGILRANFGNQPQVALLDAWVATVPEPASAGVVLAATSLLLRRHRR
jgi:uncharacterized lipoprotein YddW (UPF0748 family)